MSDSLSEDSMIGQAEAGELLAELRKSPVAYRHVLAMLDSPEQMRWELHCDRNTPFLVNILANPDRPSEDVADVLVWDVPDDAGMRGIAQYLMDHQGWISQLTVLGTEPFHALRPHLTDGTWRLSRNYALTEDAFRPRPSDLVRRLVPEDRPYVRKAEETYETARHQSTMICFNMMVADQTILCWGAFVDGELVGFVSTNPICTGVTEISWIFTAEPFRRRGIAAGLLTAVCQEAFARGNAVGYHAGSAGDDLDRMVRSLGFQETFATYRFIPSSSGLQWLTGWGQTVGNG